jgi:hypothetical protein
MTGAHSATSPRAINGATAAKTGGFDSRENVLVSAK